MGSVFIQDVSLVVYMTLALKVMEVVTYLLA